MPKLLQKACSEVGLHVPALKYLHLHRRKGIGEIRNNRIDLLENSARLYKNA